MKKFIYFSLWQIEQLEQQLEEIEKEGYLLTNIKCSYWFEFKKAQSKGRNYFLSYKSFRGPSMVNCDYSLESEHNANKIKNKLCYYNLYSVKEDKNKLSLLYDVRMDYIKRILLEKMITAGCLLFILLFLLYISITMQQIEMISLLLSLLLIFVCAILFVYYLYGYCKQRKKCKKRENG